MSDDKQNNITSTNNNTTNLAGANNINNVMRLQLEKAIYETTDAPTYDFTECKVVKVYDGDTITIAVIDNGKLVSYPVRIHGIDCAEIRGGTIESKAKANEAKKFTENAVLNKIVNINVLNGRRINNRIVKEKYGRLLAEIYYEDKCLSKELLKANLAVKYDGGTKQSIKKDDPYKKQVPKNVNVERHNNKIIWDDTY